MKPRKTMSEIQKIKIYQQRCESFKKLIADYGSGENIIYLDETIFQPHSIQIKAWARTHENQVLYKHGLKIRTVSSEIAISSQLGITAYILREKSIRSQEIIELLSSIIEKYQNTRFTIFMDNLRVHHSKLVMEKLKNLQWREIFNAAYSPEYHCIEEVFGAMKKRYKIEMIKNDFKLTNQQHLLTIRRTIEAIPVETIRKTEQRHIQKMKKFLFQNE